ncbi:proline--tRNA ligase [Candidatus Woesearchaeota archaeon]|nr:proline--tRNA ligase [Candidatus Woesearchaeota archaeon]
MTKDAVKNSKQTVPKGAPHKQAKADDKLEVGITVKKSDDASEWYTQAITKGDLIEYTQVSGCYILKPNAWAMWERIQEFFNKEIKPRGVKNMQFPLLIPESLLTKEQSHIAGFTPEVAWVTHGGHHELPERLAIRPTSETIICDAFSKWVRSYRDLPIKVNQWCSVVRWEFKHPTPFLRGREFHWQEGHTIFADKKSAEDEVFDMLMVYKHVFEDLLAVPVIAGKKTDAEKFAGAEYTTSVETFLPVGKALQGATSHYLGHHFADAFDIRFLAEDGTRKPVHHNSWGITTRSLGAMILMHGDDKGLVIPPRVAPIHVAIVPIIFDDSKERVRKYAESIKHSLSKICVESVLDDREGFSAGYKFNHWELRGVPLRLECGPKDVEKDQVVLVRRDTGEKSFVPKTSLSIAIPELLQAIQDSLLDKAKKRLEESIVEVKSFDELKKVIAQKKVAKAPWCGDVSCEKKVTSAVDAAKSLCVPFDQPKSLPASCAVCRAKPKAMILFARSY